MIGHIAPPPPRIERGTLPPPRDVRAGIPAIESGERMRERTLADEFEALRAARAELAAFRTAACELLDDLASYMRALLAPYLADIDPVTGKPLIAIVGTQQSGRGDYYVRVEMFDESHLTFSVHSDGRAWMTAAPTTNPARRRQNIRWITTSGAKTDVRIALSPNGSDRTDYTDLRALIHAFVIGAVARARSEADTARR